MNLFLSLNKARWDTLKTQFWGKSGLMWEKWRSQRLLKAEFKFKPQHRKQVISNEKHIGFAHELYWWVEGCSFVTVCSENQITPPGIWCTCVVQTEDTRIRPVWGTRRRSSAQNTHVKVVCSWAGSGFETCGFISCSADNDFFSVF